MEAKIKKCKLENCKRPYRAKDYCNVHYKKWRQGELKHSRYKTCGNEACRKPMKAKGLCADHYQAEYGKKEEAAPRTPATAPEAAAPAA